MQSNKPVPDPRIAAYIAEVEKPGIPWISTSHKTLMDLNDKHGAEVVKQLLHEYFSAGSLWKAGK